MLISACAESGLTNTQTQPPDQTSAQTQPPDQTNTQTKPPDQTNTPAQPPDPTSAQTQSPDQLKDFQARIDNYMEIHKKARASVPALPKETTDAAKIASHQQQLAARIRSLRSNALAGEVFSPANRQMVVTTIKQKTEGKDGAGAKATILGEGNPKSGESPAQINLAVNSTYPTSAPLSTMPPSLLMALPTLPQGLEFRFVGRNLILLDTEANLIVDFIPNAV
jgi:hypothetical protein